MLGPMVLAAILSGVLLVGWTITSFFHAELLHSELMALGDAREPSMLERLKLGTIWLPWIGLALASSALIACLIARTTVKLSRQP